MKLANLKTAPARLGRAGAENGTTAQACRLVLRMPMLRTAPVSKPTPKKAKYIKAAGLLHFPRSGGGSLKSTGALLYRPISTGSSKTAVTKTVLSNIIIFINDLGLGVTPHFVVSAHLLKASRLPVHQLKTRLRRGKCSRGCRCLSAVWK